jgi:hypothetical protein
MKNTSKSLIFFQMYHLILAVIVGAGIFVATPARCWMGIDPATGLPAEMTNGLNLTFQQIIDSAKVSNADAELARRAAGQYKEQRQNAIQEFLKILKDSNATTINRATAAFYLGELHADEASDVLAQSITLQIDWNDVTFFRGLGMIAPLNARDALVKIGSASVPPVIRNLADSDDTKIRQMSLQVLLGIEGDKDVVQLRLQKALKAEPDLQKQERLKTALKDLDAVK